MRRIVILGTGTGVGKTYVSSLLAKTLATELGSGRVQALKPVETGTTTGEAGTPPPGSDAERLEAAAASRHPRPHPLYALSPPVSPHLAARRAGVHIDIPRIRAWSDTASQYIAMHAVGFQVIETAGGSCSPLSNSTTNLDLARALEPATWLLVAPDSLGVLNDVRASLAACGALGRLPDFLVLSAARDPDDSTGTNAAELTRIGLPEPIAVVGRHAGNLQPLVAALLSAASRA